MALLMVKHIPEELLWESKKVAARAKATEILEKNKGIWQPPRPRTTHTPTRQHNGRSIQVTENHKHHKDHKTKSIPPLPTGFRSSRRIRGKSPSPIPEDVLRVFHRAAYGFESKEGLEDDTNDDMNKPSDSKNSSPNPDDEGKCIEKEIVMDLDTAGNDDISKESSEEKEPTTQEVALNEITNGKLKNIRIEESGNQEVNGDTNRKDSLLMEDIVDKSLQDTSEHDILKHPLEPSRQVNQHDIKNSDLNPDETDMSKNEVNPNIDSAHHLEVMEKAHDDVVTSNGIELSFLLII